MVEGMSLVYTVYSLSDKKNARRFSPDIVVLYKFDFKRNACVFPLERHDPQSWSHPIVWVCVYNSTYNSFEGVMWLNRVLEVHLLPTVSIIVLPAQALTTGFH